MTLPGHGPGGLTKDQLRNIQLLDSLNKTLPSRDDNQGTFDQLGESPGARGGLRNVAGTTSILEFPLNVASDDISTGNHGHYIMFYINQQQKAKLSIGNPTGTGSIAENLADPYDIPEFVRKYKNQFSRYESKKNNGINENVNKDFNLASIKETLVEKTLLKNQAAGGSTVRVTRAPTQRIDTAIALYMPQSVQVTYGAQYTDTQIGAITEESLNIYNKLATGRGSGDMKTQLTNLGENVADGLQNFLLASVGIIPGLQGLRETAEMKSGQVIADRLELAFKGINKRNFQYTFKMTPKDEKEVDMIRKIVFAFKANMMPEFVGDNRGGRRLLVPNTFDIAYMYLGSQNLHLHNISTCVLENMNVVYGGDRYRTFTPDNEGAQPVETTITLNFKEMELITRERVFEGF